MLSFKYNDKMPLFIYISKESTIAYVIAKKNIRI